MSMPMHFCNPGKFILASENFTYIQLITLRKVTTLILHDQD